METFSKRNSYTASDGTRYTSAQIDRKVRQACRYVMNEQLSIMGYNYCMDCEVNSSHSIIDPSHDISINECKKNGQVELAWDTENITPRCRKCHQLRDKLTLQFKNI